MSGVFEDTVMSGWREVGKRESRSRSQVGLTDFHRQGLHLF